MICKSLSTYILLKIFKVQTDKLLCILQKFTHFEFDACNMFRKNLGHWQEKTWKVEEC